MVQKCLIGKPQDKDIRHFLQSNANVTWSEEAMSFLANISDQRHIQKIKDQVDKFMLQRHGMRQVYANQIFGAKPPLHMLYPPFTSKQCQQYDKHCGPVTSVSASPFNKRLFLTCSSDGAIRIYDIRDKRPIISFEPSFGEYLNCVQWSPFRPAVFACVSNTGTLYIYDLVQSKHKPVETLKHDDDSSTPLRFRQAQEICFNPSQRNFLAVGYHDGYVRVFRISWILSNLHQDDHKLLQGFLDERKID